MLTQSHVAKLSNGFFLPFRVGIKLYFSSFLAFHFTNFRKKCDSPGIVDHVCDPRLRRLSWEDHEVKANTL